MGMRTTSVRFRNTAHTEDPDAPSHPTLFSALSVMLFFIAALPLYRELSRRSDIWWTPRAMIAPFAESKDRMEIYARGKPLAALLQAGQLRIAEDGGTGRMNPSGICVAPSH